MEKATVGPHIYKNMANFESLVLLELFMEHKPKNWEERV